MATRHHCGKEEGPVPALTFFILVAGRIFKVGWVVKCFRHPDGSDLGTVISLMHADGREGVGEAFRGPREPLSMGQLCEEAEPHFWAPSFLPFGLSFPLYYGGPWEADPCYRTSSGQPVLLGDVGSCRNRARQLVNLNTSSRAWGLNQSSTDQQ